MAVAPSAAAVLTAVARSLKLFVLPSTRRTLHVWQISCAVCTSSEVSIAQPLEVIVGSEAPPFSLTTARQPLALVQAGRPNRWSYVARSLSTLGSSYASTIATVWGPKLAGAGQTDCTEPPGAHGRLYAAWSWTGPRLPKTAYGL